MEEQDEHLDELEEKLQEASENRRKEVRKVLERLVTFEAQISMSFQGVKEGPAKTDDKVGKMKLSQTKKVYEVEEECHTQTAAEVERLKETRDEIAKKIEELDQRFGKVDDEEEKVQAALELRSLKTRDDKTGNLRLCSHYSGKLLRRHENHTGYDVCSHITAVISVLFCNGAKLRRAEI